VYVCALARFVCVIVCIGCVLDQDRSEWEMIRPRKFWVRIASGFCVLL